MQSLDEELIGKALSYSESAMVKGIINRTLIVEWGTIKEIVTKGVVNVLLSVTERPENTTIITCVLLSPCSASFSVDIEPQVGDKVLVLSPRHFDVDMFTVTEDTEVIEKPNFTGYNKLCCMAILYNQFRPDTHLKSLSVNTEGGITLVNEDTQVTIDNAGVFVLTNTNTKNSLTVDLSDSNKKITVSDSNGMTIESTSSSTKINGKLEIKV